MFTLYSLKRKRHIFTFSCIAWFIEQLFCAVSDSC